MLLVYPQYTETFWSFKHALKFTPKKALNTPLGILTVAALLPTGWDKKAIDMNVTNLTDEDIKWADYVFISAMVVQQKSTREVINRCKKLDRKVIAGGPLFTSTFGAFKFDIDHIILNEGEITIPLFLEDLQKGNPKPLYKTRQRADMTKSPTPLFSLFDLKKYASVTIQYSRGCPYDCEFCDITLLDGHKPRTKTKRQILAELEAIYNLGYRGSVFIVDDNFVGNKQKLKSEVLPAMAEWMKDKEYPFTFLTQASLNLADDKDLMQLMHESGFNNVFVGIESPNEESLTECNKLSNKRRDLVASVRKLQNHGFQVMGGFILGFDHDPISIFESQIDFIQRSAIVTAMVSILYAPARTRLWYRLKRANRLLKGGTGDNTDGTINFIPKMDLGVLVSGYKHVVHTIYSPKNYYARVRMFPKEYKPNAKARPWSKFEGYQLVALMKSMFILGIKERGKKYYWKLFFSTLRKYPQSFGLAMTLAVQGYHLRKVYAKVEGVKLDDALLARQQMILNREHS